MIKVAQIIIYPLKSAGGISVRSSALDLLGLEFDRRFMIVDHNGMFVSQRADHGLGIGIRRMCHIRTEIIRGETLKLYAVGMHPLEIPIRGSDKFPTDVQVWESKFVAYDQGDDAAAWVTKFLSVERKGQYRLVYVPEDTVRRSNRGGAPVAAVDGYPILGISQESLDDLNGRMSVHLPMNRFRPNLVFAGGEAYCEDTMGRIGLGNTILDGIKLCTRCAITTFDQVSGIRGKEPLATLAKYRKRPKGVVFGTYFINLGVGDINVGDEVNVLEQKDIT